MRLIVFLAITEHPPKYADSGLLGLRLCPDNDLPSASEASDLLRAIDGVKTDTLTIRRAH
jgi:hypothetical protein